MQVVKLTEEQKDLLTGQTWDGVTYFNPIIDANNNWFISKEEVNGCTTIAWLSTLPEIDYNPVIVELP